MNSFQDDGSTIARRLIVAAAVVLPVGLAACSGTMKASSVSSNVDPAVAAMYAPVETEPFRVPAVAVHKIDPRYYRQLVATPPSITAEPGTIVVDRSNRFLYLVQADGMSMRYGIGVGRQGFSWTGDAVIKDKQHWPKWFPPKEMVARDLYAARYADGMDGGLRNPLGARALYLYQGDKDTLFRLHGTNEPQSIGQAVSSGCIRLLNQDIIDLYERVPLGTKVVVLGGPETLPPVDGFATLPTSVAGPVPPVEVGAAPTPASFGTLFDDHPQGR
jgi:lipoprotein-anchoring transpeptidase ErfK/SrfK